MCETNNGTISNCINKCKTYTFSICDTNNGLITNSINSANYTSASGGICNTNNGQITKCINNATVSTLSFSDGTGGICEINSGQITDCINNGNIKNGTAGICSTNEKEGTISNCYNTGDIYADRFAGGITQYNEGTITNCYNTDNVITDYNRSGIDIAYLGGISAFNSGNISQCFNEGTIAKYSPGTLYKASTVGAIVASNDSTGVINNTYNIGNITQDFAELSAIGGICFTNEGTIKNSHYFGDSSTKSNYTVYPICYSSTDTSVTENCYYLVADGTTAELDNIDGTTMKTSKPFANGEVKALLHGNTLEADRIWYQHKDGYPCFKRNLHCESGNHNYENGFCINEMADSTLCDFYQPAEDTNGDGYYEITNGGNLYWFATQVNEGKTTIKAKLVNNIYVNTGDLTKDNGVNNENYREWIGIAQEEANAFNGTFDGANHTISGLYNAEDNLYESALVPFIGTNGTVKNVGVIKSHFCSNFYSGAISAKNYGVIDNCFNECTIKSGNSGGICGDNYGTISNCENNGLLISYHGTSTAGGICGCNNGKIKNCTNISDLTIRAYYTGGICGLNFDEINNCINNGIVGDETDTSESYNRVGGICGYNSYASISGCKNTGNVYGTLTGGICGNSYYSKTTDSINTGDIVALDIERAEAGGICGYAIGTFDDYIKNCHNEGNVTGGSSSKIGGICGYVFLGLVISDCSNSGTIKGDSSSKIGGICGYAIEQKDQDQMYYITITNCRNEGKVSGTSDSTIGGICGLNSDKCVITKSHNTGEISGSSGSYIGGIAGYNSGNLTICCNEGNIIGSYYNSYAGGISGSNYGIINNTYNIGKIQSGGTWIAGICASSLGTVKNSHNYGSLYNGLSYNFEHVCNSFANGVIENCYYVVSDGVTREQDSHNGTTCKTVTQFANGEVTGLLHGNTAEADRIWHQHKDGYPAFEGSYTDCDTQGHNYENGFCINIRRDGKVCDFYQPAEDTDGDGYYEITNGGNLYWFATQVNDNINRTINGELVNDIYVNKNVLYSNGSLNTNQNYREWLVIGHNDSNSFGGTFDGHNYTISGLYTSTNISLENVGLFGKATGDIKNVGIKDCYFTCGDDTLQLGGICAYPYHNSITSCYNDGCVITASTPQCSKIGGISGLPIRVTIKNCYNTGYVTSSSVQGQAGGLFGQPQVCTIENCYNTGTVTGISPAKQIGGFSGSNYSPIGTNTIVKNCYNTGTVIGSELEDSRTGGMFGNVSNVIMENCYNSGDVIGGSNGYVGGIYGRYYTNETENYTKNCYNTGNITSGDSSRIGGIYGYAGGYTKTHTIDGCYNEGKIIGGNDCNIAGISGLVDNRVDSEKPGYTVIKNCYNKASVTSGNGSYVGGIFGYDDKNNTVTSCYSTGNITGNGSSVKVGGICGYSQSGIRKCYNTGNIKAVSSESNYSDFAGGISGYMSRNSTIGNCYNVGDVTSSYTAGGITTCNGGMIYNCHTYGKVSADDYSYIISDYNGSIYDCYYLVADDVTEELDGHYGTTMKTAKQFESGEVAYLLNNKRTDGDIVWFQTIGTHDYPVFSGETVYCGYKSFDEFGYANEPLPSERPDATVNIVGDFNVELKRLAGSQSFYRGTIFLTEGSYKFRINENGNLFGGNYTISDTTKNGSLPMLYKSESTLISTSGNYTFSYNVDTNMLIVDFVPYTNVVALVDPDTGDDILKLEKTSGNIYIGILEQPTTSEISFRINDHGTLRGFKYTFVDTAFTNGAISNIYYDSSWKGATTLKMSGGVYTFKFNADTSKLSIVHTKPTSNEVSITFGDKKVVLNKQQGSDNYTATTNLSANTYVFNIDECGVKYRFGSTFKNKIQNIEYNSTWKNDTTLIVTDECAGKYNIIYNTLTKKLWLVPAE